MADIKEQHYLDLEGLSIVKKHIDKKINSIELAGESIAGKTTINDAQDTIKTVALDGTYTVVKIAGNTITQKKFDADDNLIVTYVTTMSNSTIETEEVL